jgi:hypothetical protein
MDRVRRNGTPKRWHSEGGGFDRNKPNPYSQPANPQPAEKKRRHAAELKSWNVSEQPHWLAEEVYREKIQLGLSGITVLAISSALGLSQPYAAEIRVGRQLAHPRHWQTLAHLVADAPVSKELDR